MRTPVIYTDHEGQWGISMPTEPFGIALGAGTLEEARAAAEDLADEMGAELIEAFARLVNAPDGTEYRIVVPVGSGRRMADADRLSELLETRSDPDLYPRPTRPANDGVRDFLIAGGADRLGWLMRFVRTGEAALFVDMDAAVDGAHAVRCVEVGNHVGLEGGTQIEMLGLTRESTLAEAFDAVTAHEMSTIGPALVVA